MKLFFALTLLAISYIHGAAIVDNGMPTCDNDAQMNTTFFRNKFDPTAYWVCVELYEPPVLQRCPDQTAFLDSIKECVEWEDWEWEAPV
ncbi:uncharacterized protein LOC142234146 [Haematobia irritans]|uniref:Putative secreted protein n=1 Tax=Haematobia irritans TaxID=7368 RepID=A0A1L8EBQ1_HAEIR